MSAVTTEAELETLRAVIDPLTNPTAHRGSAADAFDVVIPSMLYGSYPDTGYN